MDGLTSVEFPHYRDIPRSTVSAWNELMDLIGDGNVKIIAMSRYPKGMTVKNPLTKKVSKPLPEDLVRGQILISKKGMENCEGLVL